jgi:ferritin
MKISSKIEQLLNEQYHNEMHAGLQYMVMASYFLTQELNGFANFFVVQAQEEYFHAHKHFEYLHVVDGKLTPMAFKPCRAEFESALQVFETSLEYEREVSRSIAHLAQAAMEEQDYATHTFLQWFIKEQLEEEALFQLMVRKLKLIGKDTAALFFMDEELSKRKFVKPDTAD